MSDQSKSFSKRGRPLSGKSRRQIVRESQARHRTRLKEQKKIIVTLPISRTANEVFKYVSKRMNTPANNLMSKAIEKEAFKIQNQLIQTKNNENSKK